MNNVAKLHTHTGAQLDLIKRTLAPDCTPDEFNLYMEMARRSGLDPIRKQIYAVVYGKNAKDKEKRKMSIITGIDGYRAIAARNGDYRPDDNPPAFEIDKTIVSPVNPAGLISATVRCYKKSGNEWFPVAGTAYWEEYAPLKEEWAFDKEAGERRPNGKMELSGKWKDMPRLMLAKTAEAIALRKGWPEDLSGIYTEDEMDRASAMDMIEAEDKARRIAATQSADVITILWTPDAPLEQVPVGQFFDKAVQFLASCNSLPDLVGWRDTNRVALQSFWARAKSDALELKKRIEAREKDIADGNKA